MLRLDHLTLADHKRLAQLLARVQTDLAETGDIVARAGFVDATLRARKGVQERLIDPLHFALERLVDRGRSEGRGEVSGQERLYPATAYLISQGRGW